MQGTLHYDIGLEFPKLQDKVNALKAENRHFAELFKRYDDVDNKIGRIEQKVERTTYDYAEILKTHRAKLKNEIFSMIRGR